MNMGESQRALDGPTYPCDCGDVYHFPENLAVHKTACQMSKVKAALDAKTKESAGWEAERDRYRAECMDLRVAVEIRERNIGELTFQLRDANLQVSELQKIVKDLLPLNGKGECFFCGCNSKADEDLMHFDKNNMWGGDQECLMHPRYDEARKTLALKPEGL